MGKIEPRQFVLKDGRKGIIRTAEEADAEKVLRQIISVLEEAEYTITTYPEDGADFTVAKEREWVKNHMEGDGKLLVVAEINGEIVGSADLHNGERRRIQHVATVGITVLKEFRSLGVGKALMDAPIEWASAHPVIEKIGLGVFSNNAGAINLYKKLGFVEEGRRVREIKIGTDDYVDSILMYKLVK
ncbi:MAG: GNAT family N-acetyltransferase [Planctomycetes bacterium]|nr:GNAT family N-acetyltransferase [Planctomycetota bacterium]